MRYLTASHDSYVKQAEWGSLASSTDADIKVQRERKPPLLVSPNCIRRSEGFLILLGVPLPDST